MKKLLAVLVALGLGSTATAADLAQIGTTGIAAVIDYSYNQMINTPYYSGTHVVVAGPQFNLGNLGLVAVEVGDTKQVSNYKTLEATYANGITAGNSHFNGAVIYQVASGPNNSVTGVAEFAQVLTNNLAVIFDYEHTYAWQPVSANSNTLLASTEISLTSHLNFQIGGGYTLSAFGNSWDLISEISYRL